MLLYQLGTAYELWNSLHDISRTLCYSWFWSSKRVAGLRKCHNVAELRQDAVLLAAQLIRRLFGFGVKKSDGNWPQAWIDACISDELILSIGGQAGAP